MDCDWNSTNGKKTWLSKITEGGKESSEALAIRKGLFFTPLANSEIDKEENNEPYLPLDFKEPEILRIISWATVPKTLFLA